MTKKYNSSESLLIQTYIDKGPNEVQSLYTHWYTDYKNKEIYNLFNSTSLHVPLPPTKDLRTNLLLFLSMSNTQSIGNTTGKVSTIGGGIGGIINTDGLQAVVPNISISSSNVNLTNTANTQSELAILWNSFLSFVVLVGNFLHESPSLSLFEEEKYYPNMTWAGITSFLFLLIFIFSALPFGLEKDIQLGVAHSIFLQMVVLCSSLLCFFFFFIAAAPKSKEDIPIVKNELIPLLNKIEQTILLSKKQELIKKVDRIRQETLEDLKNTSFDKSTGVIYLEDKYGFHISYLSSNLEEIATFLYREKWDKK